jgi:hypothetical protein
LCHDGKISGRQFKHRGNAFNLEPASSFNDDVEYSPIPLEADTPWRPELRPISDAALRPDSAEHVLKEGLTPRIDRGDVLGNT